MNPISHSLPPLTLILITIFFLTLTLTQPSSSQNLIPSTCKASARSDPNVNAAFCTTSLQAAPASQCATLRGLGAISIRLVRFNLTDTRCRVKRLLTTDTAKLDPYSRQCLRDCLALFSDAIPSVKQAMRNYNAKRFDDANIQISSVMDAAGTCEQGFRERKGVVSPLTKRNSDLFQLSAMALEVMRLVRTTSSG